MGTPVGHSLETPVIAYVCEVDVMNVVFANNIATAEEPNAIRIRAGKGYGSRWIL